MMYKVTTALLVGLMLQACSGNSSSTRTVSAPEGESSLSGRVGTATEGARVSATPIDFEGGPTRTTNDSGDIIFDGAAGQSQVNGDYELNVADDDIGASLIFIATDDNGEVRFRCEDPAGCGSSEFLALVPYEEGLDIRAGVGEVAADMTVNINWITDVASSLAKTVYIDAVQNGISEDDRADIDSAVLADLDTAKTGVYNEYTMELANLHIGQMFGISDIIYVSPIGPSQMTQVTSVNGETLKASLYYGALVSGLNSMAIESGYMEELGNITEEIIEGNGQLLEKSLDSTALTLEKILSQSAGVLRRNIDHYDSLGARVPGEAREALSELETRISLLRVGVETSVQVDVPAELASWGSNIDKAKEFIVDLTEAVKNFWGADPNKSSFITSTHANRLDTYYQAHEELYNDLIVKSFFGDETQDGVIDRMMMGVSALIDCRFGSGACPRSGSLSIASGDGDEDGHSDNVVLIDSSLQLTMRPVGEEGDSGFTQFAFFIDGDMNSLTQNGVTYVWEEDVISDGSFSSVPYIALFYDEEYTSPPPLNNAANSGLTDPAPVDPSDIAVIWPLVSFDTYLSGAGSDGGDHTLRVLLEANLIGVADPLVEGSPTHYNPFTLAFWIRSVNESEQNQSSMISQIRTTNPNSYYADSRWPSAEEFFKGRDDAPVTIPNMVRSLYRSEESLSSGEVVDIFDKEVIGESYISRVRLYPYDSLTNTTLSQACSVSLDRQDVIACSDPLTLAGEVDLDAIIASNFESGVLTDYTIPANGTYTIDLTSTDMVDGSGNFVGMTPGFEYGRPAGADCTPSAADSICGFEGVFVESIELGIERMSISLNSYMDDGDGGQLPTLAEFSLIRQNKDTFALSLAYSFGQDEDYDVISDAIGVGVGSEAQAFILEYEVLEEEFTDDIGETSTLEVERGGWVVYRSGVSLGGQDQAVIAQIATRTEYTQGTEEEACGVNDRDKLSSAEGCEAVAYLTVRGALVGTIREERENVFVARFVDGTWMIIGD
ncbi:hypothetical protein [Thalassolituus maritimus]|uniref:Uncharacterized protein n=1 Tax=Thalassolituus maritimus TaxID=484498 RepID=A0ABP9ZZK7_9GAMM